MYCMCVTIREGVGVVVILHWKKGMSGRGTSGETAGGSRMTERTRDSTRTQRRSGSSLCTEDRTGSVEDRKKQQHTAIYLYESLIVLYNI